MTSEEANFNNFMLFAYDASAMSQVPVCVCVCSYLFARTLIHLHLSVCARVCARARVRMLCVSLSGPGCGCVHVLCVMQDMSGDSPSTEMLLLTFCMRACVCMVCVRAFLVCHTGPVGRQPLHRNASPHFPSEFDI